MSKIIMPVEVTVQCDQCGVVDTAYWNQYGALQSCYVCNAAPVYLSKVNE